MTRQLFTWIPPVGLGLALFLAGQAPSAQAQGPSSPIYTFDEVGNGKADLPGLGLVTFPSAVIPDPSNGNQPALSYLLAPSPPFTSPSVGDVTILDPTTGMSDIIRFTDPAGDITGNNGASEIFFYSLLGGGSLADTGFPGNHSSATDLNAVLGLGTVQETIHPDGSSTFSFVNQDTFNGMSDSPAPPPVIPEPGSIICWSLALVSLVGYSWWRRQRLPALVAG
jgi:hypothetical protein